MNRQRSTERGSLRDFRREDFHFRETGGEQIRKNFIFGKSVGFSYFKR
jgi:hypothetical protein